MGILCSELRIGNYLVKYGEIVKIVEIGIKHKVDTNYYLRCEKDNCGYWIDQFKPIPLTEEIVCNIKDIIKKNENTYILPNGLHIEFLFPEPTLRKPTSSETSVFLCDVEYLHELQNAYYWLSDKKELNIKL